MDGAHSEIGAHGDCVERHRVGTHDWRWGSFDDCSGDGGYSGVCDHESERDGQIWLGIAKFGYLAGPTHQAFTL